MNGQMVPNTLIPRPNRLVLARSTASVRVVWYQPSGEERPKSASILSKFSQHGMDVQMVQLDKGLIDQLSQVDLIMIETASQSDQAVNLLIDDIRSNSRAPLVLLTDNYTLEWSISNLIAGADAIITVNTPDEVVVARCKALLRRWLPRM